MFLVVYFYAEPGLFSDQRLVRCMVMWLHLSANHLADLSWIQDALTPRLVILLNRCTHFKWYPVTSVGPPQDLLPDDRTASGPGPIYLRLITCQLIILGYHSLIEASIHQE